MTRSVESYLKDLERSRLWKREHPERARAYWSARCDCGDLMSYRAAMCVKCRRAEQAERLQEKRSNIAACWAQGMTLREIAAELALTPGGIGVEIHRMRKDGWDLPYRCAPRGSAT